ncbi:hypothetical protein HU200_052846 [Digitaria exilis]|uniref:Uncharacterized protein n=1 Tax=Digitaria exilis TaxID=1010633 RepID=A0A835ANB8_9POAL|nr:hypothetical protein HU200_052846 [Digitaria exilis]
MGHVGVQSSRVTGAAMVDRCPPWRLCHLVGAGGLFVPDVHWISSGCRVSSSSVFLRLHVQHHRLPTSVSSLYFEQISLCSYSLYI